MTDKELLEAAARAAGIDLVLDAYYGAYWHRKRPTDESGPVWNPLMDDGDALRLAVKLGIDISKAQLDFYDKHSSDPYAATRRAIVRAAAIGSLHNAEVKGDNT